MRDTCFRTCHSDSNDIIFWDIPQSSLVYVYYLLEETTASVFTVVELLMCTVVET
jgi:hypothetical protein